MKKKLIVLISVVIPIMGSLLFSGCGKSETNNTGKSSTDKVSSAKTSSPTKGAAGSYDKISFNNQVRPIISDKCFACHGPDVDNQQSPFRLDSQENSRMNLAKEGEPARFGIVPGNPDESLILYRIAHEDPSQQMPPPVAKKSPVTEEEIAILRQWISEGAAYEKHWAFVLPEKTALPEVQQKDWVKNPIDNFILAKLESKGIKPSPEADKETLIRRVYMDLTGLPPSPEAIDAYLTDTSAEGYEKMVDLAIASKHYGERMAIDWLDVARYGDTNAIHVDNERSAWPYRDWVINAFNNNIPYNQFITEQLAGDLLPNATTQQKVATCFNRNHGITDEGGVIPEEFLVEYAVDRVSTMGSAFMGLTLGCARCHDHKFDPVTQDDFFSLISFFNNIPERGLESQNKFRSLAYPPFEYVYQPGDEERLAEIDALIGQSNVLKNKGKRQKISVTGDEKAVAWSVLDLAKVLRPNGKGITTHIVKPDTKDKRNLPNRINYQYSSRKMRMDINLGHSPTIDFLYSTPGALFNTIRVEATVFRPNSDQVVKDEDIDTLFGEIELHHKKGNQVTKLAIADAYASYGSDEESFKNAIDGNPETVWNAGMTKVHHHFFLQLKEPVLLKGGHLMLRVQYKSSVDRERTSVDYEVFAGNNPHGLENPIALIAGKERRPWQKESLIYDHYHKAGESSFSAKDFWHFMLDKKEIESLATRCMVMEENKTIKPTYVLNRGLYDQPIKDRKRDRVTPAVFEPMGEDLPKNRLGLAQWLVRADNPLTSRVTVNRLWQQIFRNGIVKTSEDFGLQSAPPSHPELLDYLAVDFRENNWDVKRFMKMLVSSATYRQSSQVREELQESDPENKLLASAPRYRLPAEVIRDNALTASGLLNPEVGGPSVRPYQPDGLWKEKAMPANSSTGKFVRDTGDKLYRRGMYSFIKQSSPPPQMELFDAPNREFCTIQRRITNTPLQALALMNDEMYLEMSRILATRVIKEIEGDWDTQLSKRIERGLRLTTGRKPDAEELERWVAFTKENLERFISTPEDAKGLLSYGEKAVDESIPAPQLAALTFSMSAALNLDETITRD